MNCNLDQSLFTAMCCRSSVASPHTQYPTERFQSVISVVYGFCRNQRQKLFHQKLLLSIYKQMFYLGFHNPVCVASTEKIITAICQSFTVVPKQNLQNTSCFCALALLLLKNTTIGIPSYLVLNYALRKFTFY